MAKAGRKHMGKVKNPKETLKRLLTYFKKYRWALVVVVICIILSSLVNVANSLFIKSLIDDYITPLLGSANPDYSSLISALSRMAIIFAVGVIATFTQMRIMVVITQGILTKIRDDMFAKMQTLPINYFDTHTHGEIMSHYTNDTDALREMISESIPQLISSCITIVAVFCAMLFTNVILTVVVMVILVIMLRVVKIIGGKSAKYFIKQQESLATVNGYIEEMINGQKVIKVFCHEDKSKEDFDKLNGILCENQTKANMMANILMPIMGNIGQIQYVIIAIAGGLLALKTNMGITLGAIASFLQLSRSFNMPVSRVSQQINSIAMAIAGAERIFELMNEEPETNNGKVTLVNIDY